MYNRYFLRGCGYCNYYPLEFESTETAELYLCLLCSKVMCLGVCKGRGFGNLSHHAMTEHCDSTVYVSITTGHVALVCTPVTIL